MYPWLLEKILRFNTQEVFRLHPAITYNQRKIGLIPGFELREANVSGISVALDLYGDYAPFFLQYVIYFTARFWALVFLLPIYFPKKEEVIS